MRAPCSIHYRLNDVWLLQTDFSYDFSPVDTKDRIAALPVDEQWRVGIGAIYDWTETRQLGPFQWANLGRARLDNSVVKGRYAPNDVFLFSVNINWSRLPWSGRSILD